jgi:hypothetical protein
MTTPGRPKILDDPEFIAEVEAMEREYKARLAAEREAKTPKGRAGAAWHVPVKVLRTESLPLRTIVRKAGEAMRAVERKVEEVLREAPMTAEAQAERSAQIRAKLRREEEAEEIARANRQAAIDRAWQQSREHAERMEALARSACHIGPGDPDWRR